MLSEEKILVRVQSRSRSYSHGRIGPRTTATTTVLLHPAKQNPPLPLRSSKPNAASWQPARPTGRPPTPPLGQPQPGHTPTPSSPVRTIEPRADAGSAPSKDLQTPDIARPDRPPFGPREFRGISGVWKRL